MLPQRIETERLVLRTFEPHDLADLHEILGNPQVGVWLGKPHGFTLSQSKDLLDRFIQHWKERAYGPWAVIENSQQRLIGYCGLSFTPSLHSTELLYALNPSHWRKGFITESAHKALEHAESSLNLSHIISYTLPKNKASRRVMEKLGMEYIKDFVHADLLHVFYQKQFQ